MCSYLAYGHILTTHYTTNGSNRIRYSSYTERKTTYRFAINRYINITSFRWCSNFCNISAATGFANRTTTTADAYAYFFIACTTGSYSYFIIPTDIQYIHFIQRHRSTAGRTYCIFNILFQNFLLSGNLVEITDTYRNGVRTNSICGSFINTITFFANGYTGSTNRNGWLRSLTISTHTCINYNFFAGHCIAGTLTNYRRISIKHYFYFSYFLMALCYNFVFGILYIILKLTQNS